MKETKILKRTGRSHVVRRQGTRVAMTCIFHVETSPSLYLYRSTRRFRCYGASCGKFGDVADHPELAALLDLPATVAPPQVAKVKPAIPAKPIVAPRPAPRRPAPRAVLKRPEERRQPAIQFRRNFRTGD